MLLLAPMEGLLDPALRDILCRVGGIDRCVSPFIRVTGTLMPERALLRAVPELACGGRTSSGVPVRPQLMGSDPACLADNAARLAALGASGIDLNFGCPARTVARHRGGAVLLDEPDLLHRIVAAVRAALPHGVALSAKMRLGNQCDRLAVDCAQALADGGAGELVVHARTRAEGYRPPAHWARIADVRRAVAVPVIANGEVWTADDARRCRDASGCDGLMLGRGIVCDPGLARAVRTPAAPALGWSEVVPLLRDYAARVRQQVPRKARAGRLKQWLGFLRRRHPEAARLHDELRAVTDPGAFEQRLLGALGGSTR